MKLSDERILEIWQASEAPEDAPDDIVLVFARAIEREAYRNGQEVMRDRTAKECYPLHIMHHIRALEIEEPK